ncbi:hypothetical protein AcV7_003031 [Taiwanofungus camphoratus]|nr:hypothetical protein AcV7_003031 [Antrodia cinnamomea]
MFPLSDFNLVCCALATFSAAVGYNVSRRRRSQSKHRGSEIEQQRNHPLYRRDSTVSMFSSTDSTVDSENTEPPTYDYPSPMGNASVITESGTLKRKSRDEGSKDLLHENPGAEEEPRFSSPPKKRCKTPPAEEKEGNFVKTEEPEPMCLTQASDPPTLPQTASEVILDGTTLREKLQSRAIPASPFFPTLQPIPAVKPSSAFTSFAGSNSAFALTPITASTSTLRPVWRSVNAAASCVSATQSRDVPDGDNRAVIPEVGNSPAATDAHNVSNGDIPMLGEDAFIGRDPRKMEDPLAAHSYAKSTHSTVTGEEDENIRTELKGTKVFIKRGDREFSDGIFGHVKLLSHKVTGDERILFRRESVLKVSMSVRLRPTVRCTFDEDQGILRVALKESEEQDGVPKEQWRQQVVVYALKRGKTSKTDFAEFARAVTASSRLASPLPDGNRAH